MVHTKYSYNNKNFKIFVNDSKKLFLYLNGDGYNSSKPKIDSSELRLRS
jgi:hypothetical protein